MATASSTAAVLGATSTVRGRISGEGDLHVLGAIEGDIAVRGQVTVDAGGRVQGDLLEASDLVIGGIVVASVRAEGAVMVLASAAVRGKLYGRSVTVQEGASVSADFDAVFDLPEELRG